MIKKIMLLVCLILVLFVCYKIFPNHESISPAKDLDLGQATIKIGENQMNVFLALNPNEQERGLSGREMIAPDQGMLFVYSDTQERHFWMKEMLFPIDIIWIDGNLDISGVAENALPESFPDQFISPPDTQYVLEVNAFYFKNHNLKIGDSLQIYEK